MKNLPIKELYLKYKIIIYPVALGVAGLILIMLVILPQILGFIEGRSTLENVSQRVKVLDVKAAELSSINSTDLEKDLNLAISALPIDKDYGSIIGLVQRIAADSQVNISALTLSPLIGEKNSGFAVKLEVIGVRQAVEALIQNIEQSPRIMKVASIDISSAKIDNTIDAQLVINAFYAPAPQSLGSIESELPKLTDRDNQILTTLSNSTIIIPTSANQLLPRGKLNPFQ